MKFIKKVITFRVFEKFTKRVIAFRIIDREWNLSNPFEYVPRLNGIPSMS